MASVVAGEPLAVLGVAMCRHVRLAVLERTTATDFDGHTEFQRLSP